MTLKLGCIADDFTGATDLANNLVRAGMRVVQTIGVPAAPVADVDAVVVALKSRTAPVAEAVADSLAAARWLRAQGAPQIYFKVCSTFDSTPAGNIGPVAEALLTDAGGDFALVTPAFPENGRTVYKGHLFVGDLLLSDSPMRHHPLTPMTDANLVRVLQAQAAQSRVGLIERRHVAAGAAAVAERIGRLAPRGRAPGHRRRPGRCRPARAGPGHPGPEAGRGRVWSGHRHPGAARAGPGGDRPRSCHRPRAPGHRQRQLFAATNAQVAHFVAAGGAAFELRRCAWPMAWTWPRKRWPGPRRAWRPTPRGRCWSTPPRRRRRCRPCRPGWVRKAGALVEQALARVAQGLVGLGVRQLVLAGGETSGACIAALGIAQLRIGPQIDPGVPWCHAQADRWRCTWR
jgi:hypothetical protein